MKWPIKKIKYFDEDLHYIWLTVSTCYAHICGKYMYLQQMNDPLLLMNWKGVHARRKCVIRLIKLYIYSVLKMQDENYTWHKIDSHLWVFCIYAVFFSVQHTANAISLSRINKKNIFLMRISFTKDDYFYR